MFFLGHTLKKIWSGISLPKDEAGIVGWFGVLV